MSEPRDVPCARIAAINTRIADQMFTETGSRALRFRARKLCEACPLRVPCLVKSFRQDATNDAIIGGLNYRERLAVRKKVAGEFQTTARRVGRLNASHVTRYLREHPEILDEARESVKTGYAAAHDKSEQKRSDRADYELKHMIQPTLFELLD
ncbi:hypothetical protein B9T39_02050 [Alloscardovia macacae]|uniref:4Fe-4S Wbl-type domain-containing protein n=1 Tax=Alloscardovia macacae TaxID=1160091 RepID=A0A1Y2T1S6_9BIFI|nr:WhiB family transcriptional regulator [Alloscardovia macacae]OTA29884.1 hypothetical protein B9T39_02050 [Alloscardovia macacae]